MELKPSLCKDIIVFCLSIAVTVEINRRHYLWSVIGIMANHLKKKAKEKNWKLKNLVIDICLRK